MAPSYSSTQSSARTRACLAHDVHAADAPMPHGLFLVAPCAEGADTKGCDQIKRVATRHWLALRKAWILLAACSCFAALPRGHMRRLRLQKPTSAPRHLGASSLAATSRRASCSAIRALYATFSLLGTKKLCRSTAFVYDLAQAVLQLTTHFAKTPPFYCAGILHPND